MKNIFQICGKLSKIESVTHTSVKPPVPLQRHQLKVFSVSTQCVIGGRESLTIDKSVVLTRVALHGPPPATEDSAKLVKAAMQHYPSTYGERYCTMH